MKQQTLAMVQVQGFEQYRQPTRRDQFLEAMERIIPLGSVVRRGRTAFPEAGQGPAADRAGTHAAHSLPAALNLADQACEDMLYDSASRRRFAGIDLGREPVPDATSLLRLRHWLEPHQLGEKLFAEAGRVRQDSGMTLKTGTIVEATLIAAPSSTKNAKQQRAPEMHQTKKGNQWHFGRKLHIGVDSPSGLAHSATVTAANGHDKHALPHLLQGSEKRVYGDNADASQKERIDSKAPQAKDFTHERVRRRKDEPADDAKRAKNRHKAKMRARLEPVFAVGKRRWGLTQVRYRGLAKNACRAFTALALANLYLARHRLVAQVRP